MSNVLLEAKLWTRHQPPRRDLNQQGDEPAEIVSQLTIREARFPGQKARAKRREGAAKVLLRILTLSEATVPWQAAADMELECACPGNCAAAADLKCARRRDSTPDSLYAKRQRYLAARRGFKKALNSCLAESTEFRSC